MASYGQRKLQFQLQFAQSKQMTEGNSCNFATREYATNGGRAFAFRELVHSLASC